MDRVESRTDRRVKLVSLTPRGIEIIDAHVEGRRRALQTFLDELPDERVNALAEAVGPILAGDYFRPQPAQERTVEPAPLPTEHLYRDPDPELNNHTPPAASGTMSGSLRP